jgi:hypothetical protein
MPPCRSHIQHATPPRGSSLHTLCAILSVHSGVCVVATAGACIEMAHRTSCSHVALPRAGSGGYVVLLQRLARGSRPTQRLSRSRRTSLLWMSTHQRTALSRSFLSRKEPPLALAHPCSRWKQAESRQPTRHPRRRCVQCLVSTAGAIATQLPRSVGHVIPKCKATEALVTYPPIQLTYQPVYPFNHMPPPTHPPPDRSSTRLVLVRRHPRRQQHRHQR